MFIPDRWIDSKNETTMKDAFIPFSIGSRSCIGIKQVFFFRTVRIALLTEMNDSLAKMELIKLTAAFFLRFDSTLDSSMSEERMEMYDVFSASPRGGRLLVNLTELQH